MRKFSVVKRRQKRAETPQEASWRMRVQAVSNVTKRERERLFPVINSANVKDVIAWQKKFFKDLLNDSLKL